MKQYFKNLILFAVPLSISAFCMVTLKSVQICDGESFTAYGFPLMWITPGVTSLSKIVDLTSFIIDLTVYFALFAIADAAGIFNKIFARKKLLTSAVLWIGAAIIGVLFAISISFDLQVQKIDFSSCDRQPKHAAPHFGFPGS